MRDKNVDLVGHVRTELDRLEIRDGERSDGERFGDILRVQWV